MTRFAPHFSPSHVSRPTLQSVLRRAHLRLAFVAVAMAAVSLIVVAVIALRAYAGNNLNLLARSLGYTVEAALVFGDRVAANEAIGLIAGDEDVAQVVVTDSKGQIVATWQLPAGNQIARLERVVADLALPGPVMVPVMHDGIVVGHVVVRGRGHQFFGFLLGGVGGILGCLAVSVFGAYVSSKRLLRNIVSPLRALAGVAHAVRRERAFARRGAPVPIAELNELGDDFNALLDEFEDWQNTLRDENASLEHKATHDALTGLPNRMQFESRLARALSDAGVTGERARFAQLVEQQPAQLVPPPGLLPVVQPTPARRSRAEAQPGRQMIPSHPCRQHEQDAIECYSVRDRRAPRVSRASRFGRWK